MHAEFLSQGKHPASPELNEDTVVAMPKRAYAVSDGATDRTGRRYDDGRSSGRMASAAVASALYDIFGGPQPSKAFDAESVVKAATEAVASEYRRLGISELATKDRNGRFTATLALAALYKEEIHLLLVGDSGIRINGRVLHQRTKLLDDITADLRVSAYERLQGKIGDAAELAKFAGALAFRGTRNATDELLAVLPRQEVAAIEDDLTARYADGHPDVPASEIASVVHGGILFGQPLFQNNADRALGYSCIDGFPVPMNLTQHVVLPAAEVATIEIFSDGYFAPGEGLGTAAWEATFDRVEKEDPFKIGRYRSVKGSLPGGQTSDDRSYLCIWL